MSLFRRKPAAESRRRPPRLSLEALENRLTPAWFLMTSNLLDVTSAPIALTTHAAAPQEFKLELDGMVRLASGGAAQEASFKVDEVGTLSLAPGEAETSIKIDFGESVALAIGKFHGVEDSAQIKGDVVVSLKSDGAAEVAAVQIEDVASIKLNGSQAVGDITLHGEVGFVIPIPDKLPSVSFDDAASLKVAHGGGGGGGKIPGEGVASIDNTKIALTGPAASCDIGNDAALTHDNSTVLSNTEKWDITPAAPSAGTASAPSLVLADMESFTLNFATANMEYKDQWASAGEVTGLKYDDVLMLNDGSAATATQNEHLQVTGELSIMKHTDKITLTPNDPTDLASDTQDIEATGKDVSFTLDDTVQLKVGGSELTSHTDQTETGDVISIELDSLLSKPGPDG